MTDEKLEDLLIESCPWDFASSSSAKRLGWLPSPGDRVLFWYWKRKSLRERKNDERTWFTISYALGIFRGRPLVGPFYIIERLPSDLSQEGRHVAKRELVSKERVYPLFEE